MTYVGAVCSYINDHFYLDFCSNSSNLHFFYTSRKCRPLANYFRTQEVLDICISVQNQTDICCLRVAYFQFQFPHFVYFCSMADPYPT